MQQDLEEGLAKAFPVEFRMAEGRGSRGDEWGEGEDATGGRGLVVHGRGHRYGRAYHTNPETPPSAPPKKNDAPIRNIPG